MKNVENYEMMNCAGCGLCESVCPVEAITIEEKDGFFRPYINNEQCILCGKCSKYCPSIHKDGLIYSYDMFDSVLYGHSMNQTTRNEAASGGITTELLRYVLEHNIVDYVVTAAEYHNDKALGYKIVTKDNLSDIYDLAGSNYCPVNIGRAIKEIKKRNGKCLIICLPCLARGIRKVQEEDIILRDRIRYIVCLLCNHVPSYKATEYLLKKYCIKVPGTIKYRGNGWFGYFRVYDVKNKKIIKQIPFSEYFETGFSHFFWQQACIDCEDHFGNYADICMGDADFVKYRENKDNQGETICFIKNKKIMNILKEMQAKGYICLKNDVLEDELKLIYGPLVSNRAGAKNLNNDYKKVLRKENELSFINRIIKVRSWRIVMFIRRMLRYEK